MRICIVAVGKLKERGLRELVDDYLARIGRHVACEEVELREGKHLESQLRGAIPSGSRVVALEMHGKEFDSVGFAAQLARWGATGKGLVAFLIGGADGLPEAVSREAHDRLSLSKLTLAHRFARLLLVEQIYRATTLWHHEPYHR